MPHRGAVPGKSQGRDVYDATIGSAGQDQGADLRTNAAQGPLVAGPGRDGRAADDLGGLRDRARFHRPLVLGAEVSLPDALLLAVHQRRVRAGREQPGPVAARAPADHPVRAGVAAVRARLPAYLLLLPEGLLPGLLARARRVRGAGAARQLHRRDQVPAHPAEPAPLLLLPR